MTHDQYGKVGDCPSIAPKSDEPTFAECYRCRKPRREDQVAKFSRGYWCAGCLAELLKARGIEP